MRRSTFMEMVIPVWMEQAMKLFAKLKEMKAAVSAQVVTVVFLTNPKEIFSTCITTFNFFFFGPISGCSFLPTKELHGYGCTEQNP